MRPHLDDGDLTYDQPSDESLNQKEMKEFDIMLVWKLQTPSEECLWVSSTLY